MQLPEICKLNADTTLKEVQKKAPFYVPEWVTREEKDFGVILSYIFTGMMDLISSRLNEAPKKHFLSFLEMVNIPLIPASPARAPLTFVLSGGASEEVFLEACTQASADGPDGKAVIFETEKNILVTPSKLVSIYSVINGISGENKKEKDKIFKHTFKDIFSVNGIDTTELFKGNSLQKHILYIGDESLFDSQKEQISIEFGLDEAELKKLDPENGLVEWKYSAESSVKENGKDAKKTEWKALETKIVEKRLVFDIKNKLIDKVKLNGIESRWLICQLKESRIEELKDLKISLIKALASPDKNSGDLQNPHNTPYKIIPDCLFSNDIPIDPDPGNLFYPFGKKPYLYDTFYIGSKEAFSKKGNKITLVLELTPGRPSSTYKAVNSINGEDNSINRIGSSNQIDKPQLSWEFWDGECWSLLPVQGDEWKKNLCVKINSEDLNKPEPSTYELTISRMPEVKLTRVNGKENYWLRIRMVDGNYGKEYEIVSSREITTVEGNKVSCAEVIPGHFFPPQITNLSIKCDNNNNYNKTNNDNNADVADQLKLPDYVLTENNLVFKNHLEELVQNNGFKPFEHLSDTSPAVYFGFDRELKKGPFSLFINVDEMIEYPENFLLNLKWQYLIKTDPELWEELEVLDETAGFSKKGMVEFNIPGKMQASGLFGLGNQFWIRAVNEHFYEMTTSETSPVHKEISIVPEKDQEIPASINPEYRTAFKFFDTKFLSRSYQKYSPNVRGFYLNSVWAVQSRTIHDELLGSGNGEINQRFKLINAPVISETVWINEFNTLSEKDRGKLLTEPNRVKTIQDSKGNIIEFWVRWTRVNDFLDSENKDRHYTIDRTDGDISFGNGKRGMVPPIGSDNIKITYSIGGGKSGNFDASKISKLQSSISFVDRVSNPIGSSGGTDSEDLGSFLERAPTLFKTRDRATALEDYEWLAKKASANIARVKTLPNFDAEKKFSTGCVTVIIVPVSSSLKPVPSSELKRRVTSYLKERCSTAVTLIVIPPYYIKIDVSAELITASINAIPVIEKEARKKITEYLHPLTGGTDRDGWNFGCSLCISEIYSILEQITNVENVNKVIMNLYEDSGVTGQSMKLGDEFSVAKLPVYALPYSGEHKITVIMKNTEKEG